MDKEILKVKQIYKMGQDDVNFNFIVPTFFILMFAITITGLYIKAELLESRTSWSKNMCIPKYVFVSGFIKKKPNESALNATYDNFKTCIKRFKTTPYKPTNMNMNLDLSQYNIFDKKWF